MKVTRTSSVLLLLVVCFFAFQSSGAFAQASAVSATHKDVAYAHGHAAQKLDVYLAKSDKPMPTMIYLHGGGWRAGSKNHLPAWLTNAVREGWLSVVSVEYRFTDVAPHPAQVNDCMRAIQFVRHNAAKWNIDPQRLGVTGGSAGGHLTLWVALHDDAADPDSNDPVEKHSSRVACAVSFAGPTDWSLLAEIEHKHPAYRQLLGYEPGTPADEMKAKAKRDVSPISFASIDDPPVMQVHGDKDSTVPITHARNMHQRLKSLGVTSEFVIISGGSHGVAGSGPQVSGRATAFVRERLVGRSSPRINSQLTETNEHAAFTLIKVQQTGGFAGVNINYRITPDGKFTCTSRRAVAEGKLDAKETKALSTAIAAIDWEKLPAKLHATNVADDFIYDMQFVVGKTTHRIIADGILADQNTQLKPILMTLVRIQRVPAKK